MHTLFLCDPTHIYMLNHTHTHTKLVTFCSVACFDLESTQLFGWGGEREWRVSSFILNYRVFAYCIALQPIINKCRCLCFLMADFTFISRPPPIGSLLSGTTYVCVPHTHTYIQQAQTTRLCVPYARAEENRTESARYCYCHCSFTMMRNKKKNYRQTVWTKMQMGKPTDEIISCAVENQNYIMPTTLCGTCNKYICGCNCSAWSMFFYVIWFIEFFIVGN